ncbi:MAG: GNAT family N-acetyltransferase [Terracidiphilus sp.]|jgi:predicted GNAT superfamily acetyltransferase
MIVVRGCHGQEELEACVQLQIETWGYDPSDVIPRKAFLVWQKVGGQVIGAFDTQIPGSRENGGPESLVGFVLSLPGIRQCGGQLLPYLHSHMLAVKQGYRDRGLGFRLKLAQREEALNRGIRLIQWTFDPLEIKNAFLNISKLGAIARSYHVDFYGVSSSRLQGGLPTDRLVAEWRLDASHVHAVLEKRATTSPEISNRINIPATVYEWKANEAERGRALAVQLENRGLFLKAFSQGLAVLGFIRDAEGNGTYLLGDPAQLESSFPQLESPTQGTRDL